MNRTMSLGKSFWFVKKQKRVLKRLNLLSGLEQGVPEIIQIKPSFAFVFIVLKALDVLHAERIGHGYRVLEDKRIYRRVIEEQVHLEVMERFLAKLEIIFFV